jgi:Large polyvalent protein associated domain 22
MADDALDYGAAASELPKPAGIAALSTKDADPDKAARALDLSKTTGIPAPVIHADVDSFTDNLKAQSASDLVKNNRQLGAYVASDPMASQVSSDDYAQLDTVSEATTKLAQPGIFQRIGNAVRDIYIDKPIEGFKEGFDYQGQKDDAQQLMNYIDSPAWRLAVHGLIGPVSGLLDVSSHAFQGVVTGTAAGLGAAYDQLGLQDTLEKITGHPQSRESLVRDLITGAQVAFPPEVGVGHAAEAAFPEMTKAVQAAEKAKPYLLDGKDVPVGVDPLIDQAKQEESKADLEKLKEAMKEAQASTTRDRAPDMFRNFIAQHTGEDTIGISADAVQKLYGDKVPAAGDNLLGFVPDMASQLLRSAATGADVQVPTADLLAHMDPEVFKELEGGIRVREGGITKDEELPKAAPEAETTTTAVDSAGNPIESGDIVVQPHAKGPKYEEAPHDPVQTVRQAAALPMMDKAQAIGMTEAQLAKYSKLIGDQQEVDNAASLRRAAAFERRTQTAEWTANRKEMQSDVSQEITQQPVHIADKGLRNGDIPKLDADSLTDDQKSALPKSYFRRGGESPDYVANILGYASGDDMITDLQSLHANRGAIRPGDYITKLISDETDRRMEAKYGKLDENVIEAAKEQVLSETQLDLLHAQTEDLAGGKLPFTKEDLRQSMAKMVGETRLSGIKSDAMLAAAGRAGRAVEDALLKGDAAEAFRQRQRQYAAVMSAKEAMKVEKAKAQFDKLAKQYSKREVAGALQEYTNQIHDLLVRLGQPVRRSIQDISESIEKDGYKSFDAFVDSKESSFRELHVPDFLRDSNFKKPVKELTADEFMQTHSALKALAFNARDELKVIRAGEKVDLAAVKSEMVDVLRSLGPERKYRIDKSPNAIAEGLKSFGWSGIQIESMFNRFDRDDPKGVFNQTLVRTYTEAANYKDRLLKQFQEKLNAVGRIPDMDKTVRNDLFVDPITRVPFDMRRRNVLGILQNIGNDSNLRKLAEGYKLDPEVVKQWVFNHTTKEDWDRAQKIGDHFRDIFDMANTMSHNVSGVGIERLPLSPIDTPHGRYDGWYNPISYDPIRPGESKKLLGPNALEQDGYYRATTPQGYTKGRTGYIAPIELNLDIVPTRMRQMIHDVAMRPAIIQLSKFFYDPEFKRSIINYYGDHQAEQMVPFLRDIANSPNFRSKSEGILNGWMSAMMHNVIGTMIGLNPSTVMKHGPTALVNSLSQVGAVPWAKEFLGLLKTDPATGNSQWKMAMDKSDELNRRMRNFQELIAGHGQELKLQTSAPKSLFGDVRSMAQYLGSFPVGVSDLLSAVPTWLAEYKEQISLGEDEGQAKFLADRAVRQAHGSSIITNKPSIARNSNAMAQSMSVLYGFFSHIMQKQYEIAWRTKEAFGMAKEGDVGEALAKTPKILGMVFAYVVAPALIEEMVSPYTNSEKDSWGKKAAKTLITGMSSSVIGLRDLVYALMNQRDPEGGIVSDTMKGFTDPVRDLASGNAFTVPKAGDFLKHMTIATGYATGLTNAQEGKSAQFIWNYFHNQEHPQGPWQELAGLRYGKSKGHSKSFDEWLHNEVGK